MTTATQRGAAPELPASLTEDDAGEELLRRFLPEEGKDASKEKPSKEDNDEENEDAEDTNDDDDESDSAEKPEDDEDGDEDGEDNEDSDDDGDQAGDKKFADDGAYIKIKQGEKEHEVPVAKLARLWGQEASITQKGMEVSNQKKELDTSLAKHTAATAALLEAANKRYEPYAQLDFNLLATQLEPEAYTNLRNAAMAAYQEKEFLTQHLDGYWGEIQARQKADQEARAKECIKVLTDPEKGIQGWNQSLYDELRAFAIKEGAPVEMINQLVEPWAFKMMHSAMLFARGKAKSEGKVKTTKVKKTPKKIVKTTNSPAAARADAKDAGGKQALKRLSRTGSADDAAEVFLARWKKSAED